MKDWYKGTGGSSGSSTMFQDWSTEKLNAYDIDPAVYDHSDIKMRPSILIDNYSKKKKYLTIIFLWDETKDFILASKYEALKIGLGEAGIAGRFDDDDDMSGISNSVSSPSKSTKVKPRKIMTIEEEATEMVQTVVNLVMEKEAQNKKIDTDNELENQSLSDLTELHKMYMTNFSFHKENGTLSSKRETEMLSQIDYIFSIIENRGKNKKRSRGNMNNSNNTVS